MAKLTKAQRTRLAHLIEHIVVLEVEYKQAMDNDGGKALELLRDKGHIAQTLAEEFGVGLPMILSVKRPYY